MVIPFRTVLKHFTCLYVPLRLTVCTVFLSPNTCHGIWHTQTLHRTNILLVYIAAYVFFAAVFGLTIGTYQFLCFPILTYAEQHVEFTIDMFLIYL